MDKEYKYFNRPNNTGCSKLVELLCLLDEDASELFEVSMNMLSCGETSFIRTKVSLEPHNAKEVCKDLNKLIDDLLNDITPIKRLEAELKQAQKDI